MNEKSSAGPAGSEQDAWSRYWSDGRVAACGAGADGRYFPPVREAWATFFASLPSDSRILDIATGNGAVLSLALDHAEASGARFQLAGVDRARLFAAAVERRAAELGVALDMRGETPAESLPFGSSSMDAVTSQYALEYTDVPATLEACHRVLKPGGRFMAILHTQDSGVMDLTRLELVDCRTVEEEAGLPDAFEALVRAEISGDRLDASRQSEPEYTSARAAFDEAAIRVLRTAQGRQAGREAFLRALLGSMGEIYEHRHAHPLGTVLEKVEQIRTEVTAHRARLEDMSRAALYSDGLERMRRQFTEAGLEITADEPVRGSPGGYFGHRFEATRS